ncbi:hypothetical protein ACAF76_006775 [Brevibacillus sp. TJ4]|uniref:hypothetical protein n=1 Tax=Brevibacillus sp. TJ4 TaxID=3234853 RepID=UPI0037D2CA97
MQTVYGVEMQVPTGKLPGFYAQVIHKIGDRVNVFDRDGMLFIVEEADASEELKQILGKAQMLGEEMTLLYIPQGESLARVDDVGFVSQSGRTYLFAEQVALFAVEQEAGDAQDRWAAREQLREHLIGEIAATDGSPAVMVLESSLIELAEGIAKAYHVSLRWLHRGMS